MAAGVMMKKKKNEKIKNGSLRNVETGTARKHLYGPYANTFAASACLMILEIAAGRLIAAFVGFSIYTWTSVIGVVLSGLALGNYLGGILADRLHYKKVLPLLFGLAAASSALSPYLNQWIGNGLMFWHLPWVVKILIHVSAIFLVPSIVLGMIGPVVAKWALDQGLGTGQTVGGVYAWGAVGSVFGTFMAGFFLVPAMGTQYIMVLNGAILGAFGLFHFLRGRTASRAGSALLFLMLSLFGIHEFGLANNGVVRPSILEDVDILYAKESQYSYIHVEASSLLPGLRVLKLDELAHGVVDMRDPDGIDHAEQYDYIRLYAALTHHLFDGKDNLRTFSIGGGAYVMPRYIKKNWAKSYVEVVEIDPEVTKTAVETLGLGRDHGLQIYHQDARNRVADLVRAGFEGSPSSFDIVYGDAFNHVSVPYHLTTVEFNESVKSIMSERGVYLMNIIDSFESGKFLGAIYGTLKKTFPNVYVFVAGGTEASGQPWRTFVILGALHPVELDSLKNPAVHSRLLTEEELASFERNAANLTFTDDYAPVDHVLADMVRQRGQLTEKTLVASRLMSESIHLVRSGEMEKALKNYRRIIELDPQLAAGAHYNTGIILAGQGKFKEALEAFTKTLEADSTFEAARQKIRQISPKVIYEKEAAL